jgi:hypothetical protein
MTASPLEHVYGDRPKTFQNLIHLLSAKIDCASRCALYEGEARSEGFEDCAQVFSELAVKEREGINSLLECLAEHVDQRQQAAG